jgi:hypothetical protein
MTLVLVPHNGGRSTTCYPLLVKHEHVKQHVRMFEPIARTSSRPMSSYALQRQCLSRRPC